MYRVAVLFAPASLAVLAEAVAGSFPKRKFDATPTAMSSADVSYLNGADLVVLVAGPGEGGAQTAPHRDFAETQRALDGMNLAGRVAGIVAVGSHAVASAVESALRASLDASEATAAVADCQLERGDELADARRWARSLAAEFIELKRTWVR